MRRNPCFILQAREVVGSSGRSPPNISNNPARNIRSLEQDWTACANQLFALKMLPFRTDAPGKLRFAIPGTSHEFNGWLDTYL
jgi:hypothetical protein